MVERLPYSNSIIRRFESDRRGVLTATGMDKGQGRCRNLHNWMAGAVGGGLK